MEGNSNFTCAVACTCSWIVCIHNCTIWGIFRQWFQKSFQSQSNYKFLILIVYFFLLFVISCYLITFLCRILATVSLVMVELLIEWIVRYFNFYFFTFLYLNIDKTQLITKFTRKYLLERNLVSSLLNSFTVCDFKSV